MIRTKFFSVYPFLLVIFLGLSIRLLLVGNTGFLADIAFWKSWSLGAIDHGIVWTAHNTNINYPPGFIYVLWLMGKFYSLIGDPHDYNTFWLENNFGFLFVSKSFAIVADVVIACLIYWFFSQKKKLKELGVNIRQNFYHAGETGEKFPSCASPKGKGATSPLWKKSMFAANDLKDNLGIREGKDSHIISLPLLLSTVFFLNPVVILDSALWGQVESFGLLFTIVAVIFLFYRRPLLASAIFTVGFLMKLQNIIFIPLFFLFIFRYFNLKTLVKSLAASCAAFFAVCLPFLIARDMERVLLLLTVNNDYFPWLSLNAHNLWWIVSGASGMKVIDKILAVGILNAKTTGLIIFSSFYLLFSLLLFLKPNARNFFLTLTLAIFAFFLFTTQSHERYSYPVIVLLLFFYPFLDTKKDFAKKYFWTLYALLTAVIFFNIHTGLVLNYPQNGIYTLYRLTTPALTIVNSYLFIILFFLTLPYVISEIPLLIAFIPFGFMAAMFLLGNFSYLFKGEVSLTQFKPIASKQDYGILQVNRATTTDSRWKSWSRLSDDYFFYRKGFGTHANSTIVFDIGKKFKRFVSDYGVDTNAPTPASVIFKVVGDGKELFVSKKMGRFDFPGHLDVDINSVKTLELVVTDAGDGINSDHADWFNPTLYR